MAQPDFLGNPSGDRVDRTNAGEPVWPAESGKLSQPSTPVAEVPPPAEVLIMPDTSVKETYYDGSARVIPLPTEAPTQPAMEPVPDREGVVVLTRKKLLAVGAAAFTAFTTFTTAVVLMVSHGSDNEKDSSTATQNTETTVSAPAATGSENASPSADVVTPTLPDQEKLPKRSKIKTPEQLTNLLKELQNPELDHVTVLNHIRDCIQSNVQWMIDTDNDPSVRTKALANIENLYFGAQKVEGNDDPIINPKMAKAFALRWNVDLDELSNAIGSGYGFRLDWTIKANSQGKSMSYFMQNGELQQYPSMWVSVYEKHQIPGSPVEESYEEWPYELVFAPINSAGDGQWKLFPKDKEMLDSAAEQLSSLPN